MNWVVAWEGPNDGRRHAPPLLETEVAAAEQQFGIVFPDDYRDFLLNFSAGGYSVRRLVAGPDGWRPPVTFGEWYRTHHDTWSEWVYRVDA